MCGQKIPVRTVNPKRKTVGAYLVYCRPLEPPPTDGRASAGCARVSPRYFWTRDWGSRILRGRPRLTFRTDGRNHEAVVLYACVKIVVLLMRRRHHCGLDLSRMFPREDENQDESHFLLTGEDPRAVNTEVPLGVRSRMYPLSDV